MISVNDRMMLRVDHQRTDSRGHSRFEETADIRQKHRACGAEKRQQYVLVIVLGARHAHTGAVDDDVALPGAKDVVIVQRLSVDLSAGGTFVSLNEFLSLVQIAGTKHAVVESAEHLHEN